MSKNLNFVFIFISLFYLILTEKITEEETMEDFSYDNYDGEQYFKEIIKDYLVEKKWWNSDKLVQPDELRQILLDIITDGEGYKEKKLKEAFDKLTDFFINKYYEEKKEIRGKDLYDLIGINEISLKFEELIGDKYYDEDEDSDGDYDDNYDYMDDVGEPNPDF